MWDLKHHLEMSGVMYVPFEDTGEVANLGLEVVLVPPLDFFSEAPFFLEQLYWGKEEVESQ